MQKFRDMFSGKRIWILGCGTSLCDIDFGKIPCDDIILACNSSVLKTDRFNYACFTDGMIPFFEYYHEIPLEKIISFNESEVIGGHYIKKGHRLNFTKNDKEACFGIDIVHCTTHLAYIMGASDILLCGCDCYIEGDYYHWSNKDNVKTNATNNIPDGFKQYLTDVKDYGFGAELNYWDEIYKRNPYLPITIVSPKSRIRNFTKKSFDEITK